MYFVPFSLLSSPLFPSQPKTRSLFRSVGYSVSLLSPYYWFILLTPLRSQRCEDKLVLPSKSETKRRLSPTINPSPNPSLTFFKTLLPGAHEFFWAIFSQNDFKKLANFFFRNLPHLITYCGTSPIHILSILPHTHTHRGKKILQAISNQISFEKLAR